MKKVFVFLLLEVIMVSKLYFKLSTCKTLSMEAKEGIPILPIPIFFPLPMPSKEIVPPSMGFRSRNTNLSSVMCCAHPLSRYQLKPWSFPIEDIYNGNNLRFWYPYLFGCMGISTLRHSFLLMDASKLRVSRHTTKVTFFSYRQ